MVRKFAISLAVLCAVQVSAQTEEATEKGRIETWIEDALSAAGRDVTISGFSGAFSSEARFDTLTIADDDGIWLSIEGATLNWSRSALLSGRVDINEIAATKIEILRRPLPGPTISTEDSQSSTFELPELPISLEIDKLDVSSIQIDASILGQALDLSLAGSAQLVSGEIDVDLKALRSADLGQFSIVAGFANDTRQLDIDVDLQEKSGGIITSLLNIPDRPELDLSLKGSAPLSDFKAALSLKTNQSEQVTGEIRYQEPLPETEDALVIGANLSGDLRPLFQQDFHEFFGPQSEINLDTRRLADGVLAIETLNLKTGVLSVAGNAELGADNLPNMFNLHGAITADRPVRLPSSGSEVTLEGLQITATFDANQSDRWTADVALHNLHHESVKVPTAQLTGTGTIDRSIGQEVSGTISLLAQNLAFSDQASASAFDGDHSGQVSFSWSKGAPLIFESIELRSGGANLSAQATIGGMVDGLPVRGSATAQISELARFSGLAARPLQGEANAKIQGRFDVLGGGFDGVIDASTVDLAINEPRLDPLLRGRASVQISAARTPEGTELRKLAIQSPRANIDASGRIDADDGALILAAQLDDLALVEPKLAGAGSVSTRLSWQEQTGFELSELDAKIADSRLSGDVVYLPEQQELSGDIQLNSPDLSTFAKLANMDLGGSVQLTAKGQANLTSEDFQLAATLKGNDVKSGIAQLDALTAGNLEGNLSGRRSQDGVLIDAFEITSPLLSAQATNDGSADSLAYRIALRDISPLAPGLSGPFSLDGSARLITPDASEVEVNATAVGPAGLSMRVDGRILEFAKTLDLTMTGAAPLGLANSFIAPNSVQGALRYDLTVAGAPQLSSVSGKATLAGARVALPESNIVLNQVTGTVALSNERAQVDIRGASSTGGSLSVTGPVALSDGNSANLSIALRRFGIVDPELFETSLTGEVRISGPLTTTAQISGNIEMGTTEVMVPSGSTSLGGDLLDIKHINAPRGVAATLNRAGVRKSGSSSQATAMPIDLVISAPNQIFVRGRGLDAELGGRLVLSGTTAEVAPSGNFELLRGRFDILGRRFVMSEGLINMRGSLDPFLRFVAETDTSAGIVRLVLEGLASEPELSFESDAGLPQEEAIAQLLFGRGLDNISALQAASLVSAIATLSGRSSGGITGQLRSALGLSDFDVTTTDEGTQQLRAGAYINENVYSEITIDSEGNQAIDLNLDITPNLKAKGGTSSSGNTGIGLFFERDY